MQLTNYQIKEVDGRTLINFNSPSLENLSTILNWELSTIDDVDNVLNEFKLIQSNWGNIDNFIEDKYEYWDADLLNAYNVSGNWFTPFSSENQNISINKVNQHVYIDHDFLNLPIVELSLSDFIDVLEQWKQILTS